MRRSRKNLKRAVVDTNIFVSGLITKAGYSSQLIKQLEIDSFTLVISHSLRLELEEVLRRTKFSEFLKEKEIVAFLRLIDVTSTVVSPISTLPVKLRDPKDERVLATALGGKAEYLVTGDEDLLIVKNDPKLAPLEIVTVKEFLNKF